MLCRLSERRLTIQVVTPAPRGSRAGNRVTARRCARLLRSLGHRVLVATEYRGGRADVLVALHARRSHRSIVRFRANCPDGRVVVVLTGTDLYLDLRSSKEVGESLALADRLVVLQPLALRSLPPPHRRKARVVIQSAVIPGRAVAPKKTFEICVVGHLREVKDPLRVAFAVRGLPETSALRVTQLGGALSAGWARRARAEERRNPRYRWLGERPRAETLRRLASARALALTSFAEGGANVVSEAIAARVPVIASRIPGSVGLLGARYPGFYPPGDTGALRALLLRLEGDARFRRKLGAHIRRLRPGFDPARERAAWAGLLDEIRRPAAFHRR
ncbi:MAG: selenoneine biosynthesis selenosugar synthase SenB [Myxococcales bacterium]